MAAGRARPMTLVDPHISRDSLRPLVVAFRELLASAPEAQAFLRDWPRELIEQPEAVAPFPSSPRFAAPRTRGFVELETPADELDWWQTYGKADFGERFLENYGYTEWIGQRGAFMSDTIACGVLLLRPEARRSTQRRNDVRKTESRAPCSHLGTACARYRMAVRARRRTGWHRHEADYVVVPLADGDLLLEEPGGGSRTATLKPRNGSWPI
jgi:hypothetical protein